MQPTDLLAHLYLSVGRLRPSRRHSPCIISRSTRANYCAQDQLDIADFLRVGTRFRKALSRVLDYAYWRAQEGDTNASVLLHDQSFILFSLAIIFVYAQCRPVTKLWNFLEPRGECWKSEILTVWTIICSSMLAITPL